MIPQTWRRISPASQSIYKPNKRVSVSTSALQKEFRSRFIRIAMPGLTKKNLNFPDETNAFENGMEQVSTIEGVTLVRFTLKPGWQWATSIKPTAKTKSCELKHTVYIISGEMRVRMDDGSINSLTPGDFAIIAPGHDARAMGEKPCIGIEFAGTKMIGKKEEA